MFEELIGYVLFNIFFLSITDKSRWIRRLANFCSSLSLLYLTEMDHLRNVGKWKVFSNPVARCPPVTACFVALCISFILIASSSTFKHKQFTRHQAISSFGSSCVYKFKFFFSDLFHELVAHLLQVSGVHQSAEWIIVVFINQWPPDGCWSYVWTLDFWNTSHS